MASGAHAEAIKVLPGDSLSLIAQRELGSSERWSEICELNRSTLQNNCNYLLPGTSLDIPEDTGLTAASVSNNPIEYTAGVTRYSWNTVNLAWRRVAPDTIEVHNSGDLLRYAVWDLPKQRWIVEPKAYEANAGSTTEISFKTGASQSVRIYPLRSEDRSSLVWALFEDLAPNTEYLASWLVVQEETETIISNFTVTAVNSKESGN